MALTVRVVETAEDRDAVARLRYQVYVKQLGRQLPEADHKHRKLLEPLDELSTVYAAFVDDAVVASLRLTPMDRLPQGNPWHMLYHSARFPVAEPAQAMVSRMLIDPKHGRGDVVLALMTAAYDGFRGGGGELVFLRCTGNLVPLYEVLGWRRIGPGFVDPEAGFRLPMVLIAGDWSHLETVKSPLLEVARKHAPNFALPDWFDRAFPEYSRPSSVRAQGLDEFMHGFASRLNGFISPLIDDLSADELDTLLASARQVDVTPGQSVMRKGDTDRDLYLILEGALEVSAPMRSGHAVLTTIGTGQIFGEGGFLLHTPRTADLTALAESRLLALSPEAFDKLSAEHPSVAMKVLRNLCRALCLRLYAGAAN